MKVTEEVAATLKSYVYIYIDPRNGEPFYIGKGKGNRLFSHLDDQSDSEKVARIAEIRESGMEPRIDILRYGLTDSEAILVEAAAIDLIGRSRLTNRVLGHHSGSYGRISSGEIIALLSAKKVEIQHRAVLITINKLYRSDMTELELYEATRGIWRVGDNKDEADYAMAVYQGIVREVYRIEQWYPAGTLPYQTLDDSDFKGQDRWEFVGHIAQDVREQYVDCSVGKGGQNPIRYANI